MKHSGAIRLGKNAMVLLFLFIAATFILAACGGGGAESQGSRATLPPQEAEDIALDLEALALSETTFDPSITDGETLYINYCAKCHGLVGLGDGPSVGSLRTQAGLNVTILQDVSDDEIFDIISAGQGVEMPPWALVLTDAQRRILVEYVRSLGGP